MRIAKSLWPYVGLQTVSVTFNLGNAIAGLVYPWLVYDLTGSAGWMGVVATLILLPAIAGTALGGEVAERLGIRLTAIVSVAFGAFSSALIAGFYGADLLTIWLLAGLALLGAVLDGPGGVAIELRVPEIARIARLPLIRANAIDDLIDNGAAIAGPALGAVLVAITSTQVVLWLVAVLNVLGAVLVLISVPRFRLRRVKASPIASVAAGLRFVWRARRLRTALLLAGFGTGIFIALGAVVLPATLRAEGQSAAGLGLFLLMTSVGAIAINGVLAVLGRTPSLRAVFVSAFVGLALGVCLLGFDRSTWALGASGAILGLAAGPLGPVFMTLLQSSAPKELRANVIGLSTSLLLVSAPVMTLLGGAALDILGGQVVLLGLSGVLAGCAVLAATLPGLAVQPELPRG